jgi:putative methyltransferase (TIGR04325 family)
MSYASTTGGSSRVPNLIRPLVDVLEQKLPPLRAWHQHIYWRNFAAPRKWAQLFYGVYEDFESARKSIPPGARIGCDYSEAVDRFNLGLGNLWPSDYPVLFWLSHLLRPRLTIFDLGGNVGLLFYGFKKYLNYPPDITWTVCEVTAAISRGTRLAEERNEQRLFFTTDIEEAAAADVLIASGALQLIEAPLWITLTRLSRRPPNLLINRVPLYQGPSFVTLYNMGPAIAPYQIWNRQEFIRHFEDCGYELVDTWAVPERACSIPFYPERGVESLIGLYLKAVDARARRPTALANIVPPD